MHRSIEMLRSLFLDQPGDRMAKRFAKNAFFVCPVIVGGLTLAFGGADGFAIRFLIGTVIATTVSAFCHLFVGTITVGQRALARRRGLPPPPWPGRGRTFLYSFTAMFPGTFLGFEVARAIFSRVGRWDLTASPRDYGSGLTAGTIVLGVVVLAELHRDSQAAEKDARLRMAELEKDRVQAELSALTAQMNPHLLFNALNTIASMIPAQPEKAEEMTVSLSELYRGVLGASKHATHSLAAELEICRNYLEIERARFGDRLSVRIDVSPAVATDHWQIPALTLQPLVENAIRHGVAPRASPGRIRLAVEPHADGVVLTVEDDGAGFGRGNSRPGTGTGLANCRERLRLHYGGRGGLQIEPGGSGGTCVRIEIPRGDA